MKSWFFISIICIALLTGACSSTFFVSKNGKGYFLGSDSRSMYVLLCKSGDFEKVLAATHLSTEMKNILYQDSCSAERSGEKVKQLYASMTSEERKDIKNAFRKNGYDINYMACCSESTNKEPGGTKLR
jgi:hypothetical protein